MNVSVSQINPIEVQMVVTLPWEEVSTSYEKAMKQVRKIAAVPGFRKGKTPEAIIKKRYHDYLLSEVGRELMPSTLASAIEENKVRSIGQPHMHETTLVDGERFTYTVSFSVMPTVELKEYKGLELERQIAQVSDEDLEQELQRRVSQAVIENEITGRSFTDGDRITMNLTGLVDDKQVTDMEGYTLTLGDASAHPALSQVLRGLGEERDYTGTLQGTEDDSFEAWRGQKVKVFIEVTKAVTVTQPVLDDTFAQSQGAASVAALREDLRTSLTEQQQDESENLFRMTLNNALAKAYDFPVPREAVEHEAQNMLSQMIEGMPGFKTMPKKFQQQMLEGMAMQYYGYAKQKVRTDYILDLIAEKENLTPSEQEIEAELERFINGQGRSDLTVEAGKKMLMENGYYSMFLSSLSRQAAVKFVSDHAKVTLVDKLSVNPMEPPTDEHHDHDHVHGPDCNHDHDHVHGPDCHHDH